MPLIRAICTNCNSTSEPHSPTKRLSGLYPSRSEAFDVVGTPRVTPPNHSIVITLYLNQLPMVPTPTKKAADNLTTNPTSHMINVNEPLKHVKRPTEDNQQPKLVLKSFDSLNCRNRQTFSKSTKVTASPHSPRG